MIVVGAQYYRPPNPPRDDWARDLASMRASGMNTVKYWACWSWMQPSPDGIDFDDLDRLMDLAADNDLHVVINTILENAPYWLEDAEPQARYHDHEDRPLRLSAAMNTPGGGWPGLCFHNEAVAKAAERFLAAVVERYRSHPALLTWDVWNEPHVEPASYFPERSYCYCVASRREFTRWLEQRYGSLTALNEAWSRRFGRWEHVQPPRLFEAVPDLIDWREFWFETLARWLEARVTTVRAHDDAHQVMTHVALSGFTGQLATHTLDEFSLTRHIDAFGTSSFPTWLMGDDHVEQMFNLETARDAAAGKPFWQAELQGGRGRRDGVRSTAQPAVDAVELWMWNALAAGAAGVMFWQWRPELLGPESPGYGLCAPDGSTTARVDAASRGATVCSLPELDGRRHHAPSVALLVSRRAALHAFATDRHMDVYRDAVLGAYRMFADLDEPVSILHEDVLAASGVPDDITTVYWAMPSVATESTIERLTGYVDAGGRLIAECAPGEYTALGRRRPEVPAGWLAAVFGVHEVETDASGDVAVTLANGTALIGAWQRESLVVDAANVIGYFPDGSAAVTESAYGAGSAVLIATYPSVAYAREPDAATRSAIASLLSPAHRTPVAKWADTGPGLISREVILANGRPGVIAVNWTTSDQTLLLRARMTAAHDGTAWSPADVSATDTFDVPARSGRLLVFA
ncbi:MAG: beta-galactosidase [Actinomycetota bacterium]|nr:beta-galactosidase [Actinomycetota bacterium]